LIYIHVLFGCFVDPGDCRKLDGGHTSSGMAGFSQFVQRSPLAPNRPIGQPHLEQIVELRLEFRNPSASNRRMPA
jgi:hypothetical protein